jgi:hypothetical protein
MTVQTGEATLLGGKFSDAARAWDAFDTLRGEAARGAAEVDVAFYGARGEYVVLVAAMTERSERWAVRVLRERGATLEEKLARRLSDARNRLAHGVSAAGRPTGDVRDLVADWAATLLFVALERQLLQPSDLLALLVASGSGRRRAEGGPSDGADTLSAAERRRRMAEADLELREVSERLEAALRAEHPDLFDRGGRLRTAALAQRVAERIGGKQTLSGDELSTLEEAADAKAARSAHAP